MYRILKCTKDTYIQDRIVNGSFRATDANVGNAGTLDLFKLYDESTLSGTTAPIELSRILVKFDLNPLRELTGSLLNLNSTSFTCTLKLFDVIGGQTTPSNFTIQLFPVSRSWDEGIGRDIASFADIDSCNFLTASVLDSVASTWYHTGANKQGLLGSADIDIISSGTLNASNGVIDLWREQLFTDGTEDLSIDVTTFVSATLKGLIPDQGFRLSFSGTQETDQRTRFVKRFITRHSTNPRLTPRIVVQYDDSIQDHHWAFTFDASGSLFLFSDARGGRADIMSGASLTAITGLNCMTFRIYSGSYTGSFSTSQYTNGHTFVTGVYSATFAVPSTNAVLRNEIISAGSATFSTVWGSQDGSVGFHTGSLTIYMPNRTSTPHRRSAPIITMPDLRDTYLNTDIVRMRVQAYDPDVSVTFSRLPRKHRGKVYTSMYYRIRDAYTDDTIVPFDDVLHSTRMSTDDEGMYFDLYMDSLELGCVYATDVMIKEATTLTIADIGRFRVVR